MTTQMLNGRERAILRAVAQGQAELSTGAVPNLYLDGRCCCDQAAAYRLSQAGLIAAVPGTAACGRVRAVLTQAGLDLAA